MQEHLTKPIEPARLYAALAHWGQRTVETADNPPADAAERVAAALRERDDPAARQITHTVKGVAANLGATALSDAASRLENTPQAGQPSDADLDLFRRSLAETMALIRGLPTTERPLAGGSGESDAKIGAAASLEAAIPSPQSWWSGSGPHFVPSVVSAFLSEAETFRAIAQRFQDERPVRPLRRPGPAPAAADTPGA
jgi:HPt (histidine-containing phosphotransfer) domain-containing protein